LSLINWVASNPLATHLHAPLDLVSAWQGLILLHHYVQSASSGYIHRHGATEGLRLMANTDLSREFHRQFY